MMLSDVMEDYLKVIYRLQRDTDSRVSTSSIADHLDVSPPTVTSMLSKLDDREFIQYEKYKGVELTPEGETVALEVIRHHRLLEAYLAEHLDYDWSEVHREADALEHHISEEFEERIAAALDNPEVDPHGDPIPSEDLEPLSDQASPHLGEFSSGNTVIVTRVRDRNAEDLQYLAKVGITPGTMLEITDIAPFGMITVQIGDQRQSLPEDVAESILVRSV